MGPHPRPLLCLGKPTTPTFGGRWPPRTWWCTILTSSWAVRSSSTTPPRGSPWWNCKLPWGWWGASLAMFSVPWLPALPYHRPQITLTLPHCPLHTPAPLHPPPALCPRWPSPCNTCFLPFPSLALSSDSPSLPHCLSSGGHPNITRTGGLRQQMWVVSHSGGLKTKIKVSAGLVSPRFPPSRCVLWRLLFLWDRGPPL